MKTLFDEISGKPFAREKIDRTFVLDGSRDR